MQRLEALDSGSPLRSGRNDEEGE